MEEKRIKIKVMLYAVLKKYMPSDKKEGFAEIELPAETSINGLFERLNLPQETPLFTFVNGERVQRKYILQHGDEVVIFPPMAGG